MNILEWIVQNQAMALAAVAAIGGVAAGVVTMAFGVVGHVKKSWEALDGGPDQDSLRVIVARVDENTKTLATTVGEIQREQSRVRTELAKLTDHETRITALERPSTTH
jgi:hypothetical protein